MKPHCPCGLSNVLDVETSQGILFNVGKLREALKTKRFRIRKSKLKCMECTSCKIVRRNGLSLNL